MNTKYLGLWINEHLNLNLMLERVSLASRRALACLIAKAKEIGGFHCNTSVSYTGCSSNGL